MKFMSGFLQPAAKCPKLPQAENFRGLSEGTYGLSRFRPARGTNVCNDDVVSVRSTIAYVKGTKQGGHNHYEHAWWRYQAWRRAWQESSPSHASPWAACKHASLDACVGPATSVCANRGRTNECPKCRKDCRWRPSQK